MSIKNFISFIFLSSIFSIIFINTKNYIFLVSFFLISLFFLIKMGYKYFILLLISFSAFLFYRINIIPNIDSNVSSIKVVVDEVKSSYIIVKKDDVKYLVYCDDTYYKNDRLLIEGKIKTIENDLDLYVFEFKDYLNNKRVFYQIENPTITYVSSNKPLSNIIVEYLTSSLENESYTFTKMLLFNNSKEDLEVYENLKNINALHLFVVSGFHINFLFSILSFIFKKENIFNKIIKLLILSFYVYLLDFSISSCRALICLFLKVIFDKKITHFDSLGISGLILLIIEPLYVFNYSFIMTYIISYSLAFLSNKKNKNKIFNVAITSIVCFLSLIPIQLLMNYKINFISLISNIFLNYVVIILFVISLIGLIISFINGNIFSTIYSYFFKIIELINDNSKTIIFGSPKPWMIVIYYVLFALLLYFLEKDNIKYFIASLISIFVSLLLFYNKYLFINYEQLTFLNVSQGDCSIIIDKHATSTTLIDTGGLKYQDIATKKIIPYLEYHGIRKIENVIITHDDFDHNGALESLTENFEVKNVITNNNFSSIEIGSITLKNLNNHASYSNNNDNSIVLYGNICNKDVLFMGDASTTIEKKIMKEYGYFNVDILKVAHHGSSSSSSKTFIDYYNPEISIISVGKNYYGHPSDSVISNLESTTIYRTDTNGTIKIEYDYFTSYYIKTAK